MTEVSVHHSANSCLSPRRNRTAMTGGYSRLFPDLAGYSVPPADLIRLGRLGGVCDGSTDQQEADGAAGWPLFGQYIAHDLTADRSQVERIDHADVENFRQPKFNLECLYGVGPTGAPFMYDWNDGAKFLIASGGWDVPRNTQGIAIISDPRNDSNRVMNQLQVSFMRAHNKRVDELRAEGRQEEVLFDEARQDILWHYQWVVLNEFLPQVAGGALVSEIREQEDVFPNWAGLTIPYEFADAAYRYGHSQIRESYKLTPGSEAVDLFPHMLGFSPLPEGHAITDWGIMFDRDTSTAQRAMKITEKFPAALLAMPGEITGPVKDEGYKSLANRDMQRGNLVELPSGEAIAAAMGHTPLSADQIGLPNWDGETPLGYYIMREAALLCDGQCLGPVGGRIVAGVMCGLLRSDPSSFLNADPNWAPFLIAPGRSPTKRYSLINLLDYATTT